MYIMLARGGTRHLSCHVVIEPLSRSAAGFPFHVRLLIISYSVL